MRKFSLIGEGDQPTYYGGSGTILRADTYNDFETGLATGTGITAANSDDGAAGDIFESLNYSGGGSGTYENAAPFAGRLSGVFTTAAAGQSGPRFGQQANCLSSGMWAAETMLSLDALPALAAGVRVVLPTNSAGAFQAEFRINNAGIVQIREPVGAVVVADSSQPGFNGTTYTYVPGTPLRLQTAVLAFDAVVGQLQMRILNPVTGALINAWTSAAAYNTLGVGGLSRWNAGVWTTLATTTVRLKYVATRKNAYPITVG